MTSSTAWRRPLVSVIIPTFNRVAMLREAIDSVYAQEGIGDAFDIEVIVVDDASSDTTADVARDYPVRYVRLEKNGGASAARNAGIRASTGPYIAMLDDDDLWMPHRLKAHVPHLEMRPDLGVVYGQVLVTGDGPDTLWPDAERAPSGDVFATLLMEEFIIPVHVIVRRDAFERAGYFDESLRTMEHHEMYLRLSQHVSFQFLPGAVAIGRFSPRGKWFTNMAAGNYQTVAPMIVERALARRPSSAENEILRRRAALSWFTQIAYWVHRTGNAELLRRHILDTLEKNPWMLRHSTAHAKVSTWLIYLSRLLATSAHDPLAAIESFEASLVSLAKRKDTARSLRSLRGDLWAEAGSALVESRRIEHRRPAGIAMTRAARNKPRLLREHYVIKALIRAALSSPHWDPIIAWMKRRRLGHDNWRHSTHR
jgi:glycosyltransferase involved in cell wall biosynthesis